MRHAVEISSLVEDNQIELEADLPTSCESCEGTGAVNGEMITCSSCNGQGRVRRVVRTGPFQQQVITDCEDCSGRGKIPKSVCIYSKHFDKISVTYFLTVDICQKTLLKFFFIPN